MSKEIGPVLYTTGSTLRAMVFNQSGQVRDVTNATWDTWADGDIDTYDIALTELGTSGIYYADAPASVSIDLSEYDLLVYTGAVTLANIRLAIGLMKVGARNTNLVALNGVTPSLSTSVDANVTSVNDIAVTGSGTEADPWGP